MSFAAWLSTPLGEYLKEREQAYFDETVADIFGFHALQIGLPECPLLAQSRMAPLERATGMYTSVHQDRERGRRYLGKR